MKLMPVVAGILIILLGTTMVVGTVALLKPEKMENFAGALTGLQIIQLAAPEELAPQVSPKIRPELQETVKTVSPEERIRVIVTLKKEPVIPPEEFLRREDYPGLLPDTRVTGLEPVSLSAAEVEAYRREAELIRAEALEKLPRDGVLKTPAVGKMKMGEGTGFVPKTRAQAFDIKVKEGTRLEGKIEGVKSRPVQVSARQLAISSKARQMFAERMPRLDSVSIRIAQSTGAKILGEYALGNIIVAEVPAGMIERLAEDPDIEGVWLDTVVEPHLGGSTSQIGATRLWDDGYNGTGIRIAILDSGIDASHPMLKDASCNSRVVASKDYTGDSTQNKVHGTHVAGIAAGSTDCNGQLNGVAPQADIVDLRVINSTGSGSFSWIINAINDVVYGTYTADIISMSFGVVGYCYTADPLCGTISDAYDAGVIVFASSGNYGIGWAGVPGCCGKTITVGAVKDDNSWAAFDPPWETGKWASSGQVAYGVGIKPDVVAPGVNIESAYAGGGTALMSGTSVACPHAAGAAALLLQRNQGLTPFQVKLILESTAVDLGPPGKDVYYGSGRINLMSLGYQPT